MDVHLHELIPVLSPAEQAASQRQLLQRQQRQLAMSDTRRALVLDAARSVFAEHGIEGASIREIARRAGYTPGAIYSYFDSKEAIYEALVAESLERLNAEVGEARQSRSHPRLTLAAKAQAWFGFYAGHPRDLELGFHLLRGMAQRERTEEPDQHLQQRLMDALRPCELALQGLGLSPEEAKRENAALFAHGLGLLLLMHAGRMQWFGQSAELLFAAYVEMLVARLCPDELVASRELDQPDLFDL